MTRNSTKWTAVLCVAAVLLAAGCGTTKVAATTDIAVSKMAVDNAANAGGAQYASIEMTLAREKLARANTAMNAGDYELASDLANQSEVDAKLAQSKAGSAKAQLAANAVQEDIRVLREELKRVR